MTKLCARGKSAAKRKFKVYPSAYANAYASKICAGKAKDPSGVKRKDWGPKKANKGLHAETPKNTKKKPISGDPRKRRKQLIDIQNPISEYDKKGKLKYTGAKVGMSVNTSSHMKEMEKGKVKINKVIKGLKKASKLHAGQAKSLSTIKLSRGGGAAIRGNNFKGVF